MKEKAVNSELVSGSGGQAASGMIRLIKSIRHDVVRPFEYNRLLRS